MVSQGDLVRLISLLTTLNPRARIQVSQFGKVPLDSVLSTGLFDFEQASQAAGWLQELRGAHVPETVEYGISSFVYHARRPFHPQRFWELIHSEWEGVIRSKGWFWLASRHDFTGSWSQAGGACRHGMAGIWWSALDETQWPEDADQRARIRKNVDGPWGDRRQELVFIGMEMNEAEIRAQLDACLLTEEEMAFGLERWKDFPDPFPRWAAIDEDETQAA
jgi:G3E family GTPase